MQLIISDMLVFDRITEFKENVNNLKSQFNELKENLT